MRDRPRQPRRPSAATAPQRENLTLAQQHDLAPARANELVFRAGVKRDDHVIEIGPGTGAITGALLATGATVQAVERDAARVTGLQQRFDHEITAGRLLLSEGDALTWRPTLPVGWRVVANPPFNLTAALLRLWLLESREPPVAIDLVLQREAADKFAGSIDVPGAHTRTSALVALAGTPRIVGLLRRDDVSPPSRVDLCTWSFRRRDDAPPPAALKLVDRLLSIAFAGPRSVAEALRGVASAVQLRRQGAEHGWDPAGHPRDVPPAAWLPLANLLKMCGKI